jgi:hypothetical protein
MQSKLQELPLSKSSTGKSNIYRKTVQLEISNSHGKSTTYEMKLPRDSVRDY